MFVLFRVVRAIVLLVYLFYFLYLLCVLVWLICLCMLVLSADVLLDCTYSVYHYTSSVAYANELACRSLIVSLQAYTLYSSQLSFALLLSLASILLLSCCSRVDPVFLNIIGNKLCTVAITVITKQVPAIVRANQKCSV